MSPADRDGLAARSHGPLGCLEYPHDVDAVASIGQRPASFGNALDKVLALHTQRLRELERRDGDVAAPEPELEFREAPEVAWGVGRGNAVHTAVEQHDPSVGADVVIDGHLLAP